MRNPPLTKAIWVSVVEAAKITGYNHDHTRRLARENARLPEDQRSIKVRKQGQAYELWLPDLLNYVEKQGLGPMTKPGLEDLEPEEIWVTPGEGADFCGYNQEYVGKLIIKIAKKPENEREVKIRRRSFGYEIWLPDLVAYLSTRNKK